MKESITYGEGLLYGELSHLWKYISPPAEYADLAQFTQDILKNHKLLKIQTILELGCGGGHFTSHLANNYEVTGLDYCNDMLKIARETADCKEFIQGDFRTVRLNKQFDAVILYDASNHISTKDDMVATFKTAWDHLKPGGVFLAWMEQTIPSIKFYESPITRVKTDFGELIWFEQMIGQNFKNNTYDFNLVYILNDGKQNEIFVDKYTCGIFPMSVWSSSLNSVGFSAFKLIAPPGKSGKDEVPAFWIGVKTMYPRF